MTLHILLVDDDSSVLEWYRELLLQNFPGATIICAEDGQQALQHCHDKSFSLVVTDYRMPKLDGIAFIENLRTLTTPNQFVPVVLLSGFISHIDKTIMELFDVEKLEKPANSKTFLEICTRLTKVVTA